MKLITLKDNTPNQELSLDAPLGHIRSALDCVAGKDLKSLANENFKFIIFPPFSKELDLKDVEVATPAFMTIIMIPFTYNISFGIAFGLLSHVLIKVFLGKAKEIKLSTWVVFLLFCALFLFTH